MSFGDRLPRGQVRRRARVRSRVVGHGHCFEEGKGESDVLLSDTWHGVRASTRVSRNTSPHRATARWALIPTLFSLWALAAPGARAADSGYTTGNAGGAGATWNDAAFPYDGTFTDTNLTASDDSRAVNTGGTDSSEAGEIYNFIFGVPSGATILGIQVRVEGSSSRGRPPSR